MGYVGRACAVHLEDFVGLLTPNKAEFFFDPTTATVLGARYSDPIAGPAIRENINCTIKSALRLLHAGIVGEVLVIAEDVCPNRFQRRRLLAPSYGDRPEP
jgi:hypothetical protein